jgi:hypothetical protein
MSIPKGSWVHSAKHYRIENGILYASLYKFDGKTNDTCIAIYDNVDYHNTNGNFTIGNIQNTLFVCLGNQLGNCLRILSSAVICSQYYGKNIFIDFDYPGLINKEKIIIQQLFPHLCLMGCSHLYQKINYIDCVDYANYNHTNYHLYDEGRLLKLPDHSNFSITETIYSIIPGSMTDVEYNHKKIEFYASVPFPAFLLREVNSFLENQKTDIQNVLGFHIRYTDNLTDTNKQKYNTDINIFYDKLREESTKENIFLCSDNYLVIQKCKNINPNIITPGVCSNPLYQALYEMILLSKTKCIIGSNSSTFSYESAYLSNKTDIELYELGEWKHYTFTE